MNKHLYPRYEEVLGILNRDMYEVLEEKGDPNGEITIEETLAKISLDICKAEISLKCTLKDVSFSNSKKKFDFNFEQGE